MYVYFCFRGRYCFYCYLIGYYEFVVGLIEMLMFDVVNLIWFGIVVIIVNIFVVN